MTFSITKQTVSIEVATFSSAAAGVDADVEVDCLLWGDLSKPLIVLMGGISASKWALDSFEHGQTGWWNQVINQQSCLNTVDYCFLTFDYFAAEECHESLSLITTADQAQILHQIQTKLSLPQFHAVIGSSYGGMVSLAFAALFPTALARLVCIAAADYNSVKSQALRVIQRQIIQLGVEQNNAVKAYSALARSLAMIGYRGESELEQRFQSNVPGQALHRVSSYLNHHGEVFAEKFSVSRYCQLSQSIDFHQVDVSSIQAKTQLIGITSDQMVPIKFIQDLQQKIQNNSIAESCLNIIDSHYGHDGFLLEAKQLNQIFQTFLSENKHDYSERNHRCASGY
jgi:homoserine O-acetyltransferase